MKKTVFHWTGQDDMKLIRNHKKMTMQQVADLIGCTKGNVIGRARKLGLSFRKYGENHHSATTSNEGVELARLLREEGMPAKEVSEKLEISVGVIRNLTQYTYRTRDHVQC